MNRLFLWDIDLSTVTEDDLRNYSNRLSPDEQRRAGAFRFQPDRDRFVAGRAILKTILAGYVGQDVRQVQFEHSPLGKPRLIDTRLSHPSEWEFSFSKSQDRAICVVSNSGSLGADIEVIKQIDDMNEVAETIFSTDDMQLWRQLAATEKQVAFYRAWTRKEAVSKVDGSGISDGVKQFSVPMNPFAKSVMIDVRGGRDSHVWLGDWPESITEGTQPSVSSYLACVSLRKEPQLREKSVMKFCDHSPMNAGETIALDEGRGFPVPKHCRLTVRELIESPAEGASE